MYILAKYGGRIISNLYYKIPQAIKASKNFSNSNSGEIDIMAFLRACHKEGIFNNDIDADNLENPGSVINKLVVTDDNPALAELMQIMAAESTIEKY